MLNWNSNNEINESESVCISRESDTLLLGCFTAFHIDDAPFELNDDFSFASLACKTCVTWKGLELFENKD